MGNKLTFYIVRHGKTILNTLGRVQGWSDSPLTEEGEEVAKFLGIGFKDIKFEAAYCSDLRRTRQTVQIILKYQGQNDLPVIEKEGFREVCFGSYESNFNQTMWREAGLYLHYTNGEKLIEDVFSQDKKITYEQVVDSIKALDQMGIAEDFKQVEERTHRALSEIVEKESKSGGEGNILVVAHGMCIMLMLMNFGGRELLRNDLDNASVCKVVYENGEFRVESMGDLSYVENGRNNYK